MDSTTRNEPVRAVLGPLRRALTDHPLVLLTAPPGAGKTTLVPSALLNEPWLAGRKILILAPRRLAARAAASRIAFLLGEEVGETAGYRVRLDSRVSAVTRIEVITEGILTRKLQHDPELADIGLVIFDEFHERSLDGDLGLALCRDLQGVLNPDLRLLIMSATLEIAHLRTQLGDPPVLSCSGRSHPVTTRYLGPSTPAFDSQQLYRVIARTAREEQGSLLVFLPGGPEIRILTKALTDNPPGDDWEIFPLYGNLDKKTQERAIQPSPDGRRKVVLATNIAETSLTIEGIGVVIDSGLERRLVFDPGRGLSRLVTMPITRASAEQRQGRAGRTGPGLCLRLWTRYAHHGLTPSHRPEIESGDLCSLILELALWGVTAPDQLSWLTPPPQKAVQAGRDLLQLLGAVDRDGRITTRGKMMAELPVHPRLAAMLLQSATLGQTTLGCDLAALIEERDPLTLPPGSGQSDLQLRLDLLGDYRTGSVVNSQTGAIDRQRLHLIKRLSDDLKRRLTRLPVTPRTCPAEDCEPGRLLALAFPDRIAQKRSRGNGRFLLSSGSGGYLDGNDPLSHHPYLVVTDLDALKEEARIYRAVAYSREELMAQFANHLTQKDIIEWDPERQQVVARRRIMYRELLLEETPLADADPQQIRETLLTAIRTIGLEGLPWSETLRQWRYRLALVGEIFPQEEWPDVSDGTLLATLDRWLGPFVEGKKSLAELTGVTLKAALQSQLSYQQQKRLDLLAPVAITVPSTRQVRIDYSSRPPVLAVRLQEMFGCEKTPHIAEGHQPLVIHLLSPAGRPLQITQDLQHFWHSSYDLVRKEMKGRYPKHHWPEDPLKTAPTRSGLQKRKR